MLLIISVLGVIKIKDLVMKQMIHLLVTMTNENHVHSMKQPFKSFKVLTFVRSTCTLTAVLFREVKRHCLYHG